MVIGILNENQLKNELPVEMVALAGLTKVFVTDRFVTSSYQEDIEPDYFIVFKLTVNHSIIL